MELQNISCFTVPKQVVTWFCVAGVALRNILICLQTCRKSFSVAGAMLMGRFQKMMSRSLRGRRAALWRPPSLFCVAGAAHVACFVRIALSGLPEVVTKRQVQAGVVYCDMR